MDFEEAAERALALPRDHPRLRPSQKDANTAVEQAVADRKPDLLVAMATGTSKTFTLMSQAYRVMKAGIAKRILFLVDRRARAAQAARDTAASAARGRPALRRTTLGGGGGRAATSGPRERRSSGPRAVDRSLPRQSP